MAQQARETRKLKGGCLKQVQFGTDWILFYIKNLINWNHTIRRIPELKLGQSNIENSIILSTLLQNNERWWQCLVAPLSTRSWHLTRRETFDDIKHYRRLALKGAGKQEKLGNWKEAAGSSYRFVILCSGKWSTQTGKFSGHNFQPSGL